jgi:hypothetical protein
MKTIVRSVAGLIVGLGLLAAASPPTMAQELPTGAARVVEKVQTRIFISKASLLTDIAEIQAKAEGVAGGLADK